LNMLAKILSEITKSQTNPEFSIRFTVADSDKISSDLLENAAKNALEKAKILTRAAGVSLGELLNINYSWVELDLYSHTVPIMSKIEMNEFSCVSSVNDIEPEDIKLSDTVTFVWALK